MEDDVWVAETRRRMACAGEYFKPDEWVAINDFVVTEGEHNEKDHESE